MDAGDADPAGLADTLLRQCHLFDDPVVGLVRRITEGEDAVLQKDHAFDLGILLERFESSLSEGEARHDIGYERHRGAVDLQANGLAMRLVREREDGVACV